MGGTYRVLVVDDSLFMQKLIAKSLRESEFQIVATGQSGDEAVAGYREHAPDLVLMDIVMPSKTGKDALKEILALDPAARVVMISSLSTRDAVDECLAAGARRFIQKPFQQAELVDVLRETMQGQGQGTA